MAEKIKRRCIKHGMAVHLKRPDSGWRCRLCNTEYVDKAKTKVRNKAIKYKGGKCIICGYDKCTTALIFHHRDPAAKDFTINKGHYRSFKKIKHELDKCDLVCANCHAEIHYLWRVPQEVINRV